MISSKVHGSVVWIDFLISITSNEIGLLERISLTGSPPSFTTQLFDLELKSSVYSPSKRSLLCHTSDLTLILLGNELLRLSLWALAFSSRFELTLPLFAPVRLLADTRDSRLFWRDLIAVEVGAGAQDEVSCSISGLLPSLSRARCFLFPCSGLPRFRFV